MENPCRFLAILGLVVGLIVAKICMTVMVCDEHEVPAFFPMLSFTTLACLVWIVKYSGYDQHESKAAKSDKEA